MKYFGTDGIRGIPNQDFTPNFFVNVGMALSCLDSKYVVIATDTRISKDAIASLVGGGCLAKGLNVCFAGILSTPALIFYTAHHHVTGVMITASHNPYTDNGIKIFQYGTKLSESEEEKIENLIENPEPYNGEMGQLYQCDILDDYLKFLKQFVCDSDMKICIDCANGATYRITHEIFPSANIICDSPDGYNINLNCGSTHLQKLIDEVKLNRCDLGFAFDGDGDRCLCVDRSGNIIDGDHIIYFLASYRQKKNILNQNHVVMTVMSNLGIIKALNEEGISVSEANVGDKYVLALLKKEGYNLGGEASGHILLSREHFTGDGIFVALNILRILQETKTDLDSWFSNITLYAHKMINVKVTNKEKALSSEKLYARIDQMKRTLHNDCKIIVRASGTENLIRVSVMAKAEDIVDSYCEELVDIIKESFND